MGICWNDWQQIYRWIFLVVKPQSSSLSLAIRSGLTGIHNAFKATLAGYLAAVPTRTVPQASRINTNPNATQSQMQRVQIAWDGENIVKNSDFGANYVQKRRMYCTNGATWSPDTGDVKLDEDLLVYLNEQWATMGNNCSMLDTVSTSLDVELPMRGDSGMIWQRDESRLRLGSFTADCLGELYYYYGTVEQIDGMNYYSGIFTYPANGRQFQGQYAAFKVYERIDQWYGNPSIYPASDVMFCKDDLIAGMRGVSKFAQGLPIIGNRDQILYSTMQTMQQQSKMAAIASNNAGEPDELTYDTQNNRNGTVEYVERYGDGPVTRWKFNGDSYQVLKAEHPSESFQLAMDRLDEKAALAIGFPYSFLFSPRDSGGAPSRFEYECAGKEITRLRNNVYRPKLNIIAYVTIMDALERKVFRPRIVQNRNSGRWENVLTRGVWNFGTLPSADAFRDSRSDIDEIRAGVKTRDMVTTENSGTPYSVVLRKSGQEALAQHKTVQDLNKQLEKGGYEPTITINDIAMAFANPQQAANAEAIDTNGQTVGDGAKSSTAKLRASNGGEWKTVNGRHIFIKDGQSVDDALSGNSDHSELQSKLDDESSHEDRRIVAEEWLNDNPQKRSELYSGLKSEAAKSGHVIEAYHGTNSDFSEFDKSKSGSATSGPGSSDAIFVSEDKSHALERGSIAMPVFVNPGRTLIVDKLTDTFDAGEIIKKAKAEGKYQSVKFEKLDDADGDSNGRTSWAIIGDNKEARVRSGREIEFDSKGKIKPVGVRF